MNIKVSEVNSPFRAQISQKQKNHKIQFTDYTQERLRTSRALMLVPLKKLRM